MPMNSLEQPAVLFFLGVIQVLGLLSALATRISLKASCCNLSQWVFVICLSLVALTTILTVGKASGCWLVSGTTFSLMVVTAIGEFGRRPQETNW